VEDLVMKARYVWLGIILLCVLGLGARAAMVVTTEAGQGADTYCSNDGQNAASAPTVNHGGEAEILVRQLASSRSKTPFIRFDLSGVDGEPNDATITIDAAYLKGGAKTASVYGILDGLNDYWNEMTITYNTAPVLLPATLGNYSLDMTKVVLLGTIETPALPDPVVYPVTFSSNTTALPLTDFLKADTNGLVTFVIICGNDEGTWASKEHATHNPPTLNLPNCYPVNRASNPTPPVGVKVLTTEYPTLSWTNPEPNMAGGVITCDVYFGASEPNLLLPNYGLSLLASGISETSVAMPTLETYKTYYWMVDTYDASRDPEFVRGKVWNFNTNNSAPVVNAGPDQYVWVTKTVIDTTSDADTSLRDANPDGANTYMDVRGGSVDRAGYLRFDLSELSSLGPGTLQNVSLTLSKVAGSRNDTINNGRFSLHGLNNVAGNTPQNWSEATLTRTGAVIPGQEWNGSVPLTNAITNGWITDLDDGVAGISEVIASDVVTITGSALEAFLQSRINDGGLVTFIIACEDSNDRGYGIASKENATPSLRPRLQLTYVLQGGGTGDAVVTLSGSYTDDGLPAGTETVQWTQVSGPETVTISPDNVLETQVTLGTVGTYVFQLAANDTELTGTDTVQVYVGFNPCDAAQHMPTYTAILSDLNSDCFVNLKDVAEMAAQWLDCNSLQCP
jgi:hypothetical protein